MTGVTSLTRKDFERIVGNDPRAIRAFENLFSIVFEGITAIANGGTGLAETPEDGEVLIGNNGAYSLGLIDGSANIQITSGPGSISITVYALDAGLVNSGTLSGSRLPAFTGDVTSPAGSTVNTLATVNGAPGVYGDASNSAVIQLNGKGLVTGSAMLPIAIANTQVSGLGTISTQNANAVDIDGGTIDGTPVGATTQSTVRGTTLQANGGFGCNTKSPQTAAAVNAAISATAGATYTAAEQTMINDLKALSNQLRALLIANGQAA